MADLNTGPTDTPGNDIETITRRERERFEALIAQDVDALTELLHPELLYTHTNGSTDTYTSYLRKLGEGAWDFHEIDHPVERITVVGDTALVLGEMHADYVSSGERKQLHNVTLAVWQRDSESWKLLAFHPTPK